jgi:hypothetical protein
MKNLKKSMSLFAFTILIVVSLGFSTINASAQCANVEQNEVGLCEAYCIHMNCEGIEEGRMAPVQACDKVLEVYCNVTGGSPPPCAPIGSLCAITLP